MSRCTGVVEGCKNAGRTLFFDKVAYDLVVEILDRCPCDLFAHVFLLLGLQGQLNENLLKFLVDIVDTQLLKRVVFEDLEPKNILENNIK